jgi:hypothetical protein
MGVLSGKVGEWDGESVQGWMDGWDGMDWSVDWQVGRTSNYILLT